MLADSRVTVVLPVVDLDRARKFYEEKLGLRAGDAGVMFQCGLGSQLVLYHRDSPTKADIILRRGGKLTMLKRL